METVRIDALARTLAEGRSRRGLLGLIAASGANWLALDATAKKKHKKKHKQKGNENPSPTPTPPPPPCATTCAGCCAGDGTCQVGTSVTACGMSGETCEACAAGQGCQSGNCVTLPCGAGGPCLVFVTSGKYFGMLGGLQGADNLCQILAANALPAALPGTYKAWLATQAGSPATRFVHSIGPYRLVTGTTIANNWDDLIDGTLAAPIDVTENGQAVSDPFEVWTNVDTNGTPASANDCATWNSSLSSDIGRTGNAMYRNSNWTQYSEYFCVGDRRLYCFQQS